MNRRFLWLGVSLLWLPLVWADTSTSTTTLTIAPSTTAGDTIRAEEYSYLSISHGFSVSSVVLEQAI